MVTRALKMKLHRRWDLDGGQVGPLSKDMPEERRGGVPTAFPQSGQVRHPVPTRQIQEMMARGF